MNKILLLVMIILFIGCEGSITYPADKLKNWHCSTEELKVVKERTDICSGTSYYTSHCFLTAVQGTCVYMYKVNKNEH